MPTARAFLFLFVGFVVYLFANQTQVGWLYVVSALLLGVLPVAWWLNRGVLRGIKGERTLVPTAGARLHEGEPIEVRLALTQSDGGVFAGTAALIHTVENCPLVAPDDSHRALSLFVPSLPPGRPVTLNYEVQAYRRGLHEFSPLELKSGAPFGLFRRRASLAVEARVLVYPEVRTLRRLAFLDTRPIAERFVTRAGHSTEVMGVRPYRSGDSPRHIHWRSVARRQQLISKEFAEEAQPGLTLVLDAFAHPYPVVGHKHTPFEWAVKAAASIGEYAHRHGIPLHLLADERAQAVPIGALTWEMALDYLARVMPRGEQRLPQLLSDRQLHGFTAIVLPWPDESVVDPLINLRFRAGGLLAVLLDPASFPAGGPSAVGLQGPLESSGVETRLVRFDPEEDWTQQLSPEEGARESVVWNA